MDDTESNFDDAESNFDDISIIFEFETSSLKLRQTK